MSDTTFAKATIAVELIRSGLAGHLEGLEEFEQTPDKDWRSVPSLTRLRKLVDAVYRSLDEPVTPKPGRVREASWG